MNNIFQNLFLFIFIKIKYKNNFDEAKFSSFFIILSSF